MSLFRVLYRVFTGLAVVAAGVIEYSIWTGYSLSRDQQLLVVAIAGIYILVAGRK